MSAGEVVRVAALLARLARGGRGGPAPRPCAGELACDAYEPTGRRRALVIAVHGVTLLGKDDHRLGAFARALARSGARCVVPTLPALADGRWDAADVEALGRLIEAETDGAGRRAVLVGFSHGGSLALLAAARPRRAARVAHVLAFGAYASLERTLAGIRAAPEPTRAHDLDDLIYASLLQVHRWGAALGIAPEVRAAADDLLRRYCDEASDEEKARFFERHLRPLDLLRRPDAQHDPAVLSAVSPQGRLSGLTCSVDLVQDPGDLLAPAEEGEALLRELRASNPGARHRLLVTRLLRHVTPSGLLRVGEAVRLASMLAPLVGG